MPDASMTRLLVEGAPGRPVTVKVMFSTLPESVRRTEALQAVGDPDAKLVPSTSNATSWFCIRSS